MDRGSPSASAWAETSVSVVVPTHNRPTAVHEAVDAIVGQQFDGHIEVIVVFDNCDPHPIDLTVTGRRAVRTLVNDMRTPGLAGARNTGILAATGDYIAFCDDDDVWLQGKLQSQLRTLAQFDADAVCATGILVDTGQGTRVRRGPTWPLGLDDFLNDRIMEVHSSTLLMRRPILTERIGLVDENIPGSYGEDYELLLRATRHLPVISVPDPLVRVAFRGRSLYASHWRTIIRGLAYLLDRYPEFTDVPRGRARIQGQIAFAHAALGERGEASRTAVAALQGNIHETRAYIALLVCAGLPASWVTGLARRLGRGVT